MLARILDLCRSSCPAGLMRSLITVLSLLCAVITSAAAEPLPAPVAIEIPSAGYVLHAQLYRPSSA